MTDDINPGGWPAANSPAAIVKLIQDYFAPWGAWKAVWWEGEVSDAAPFGGDALLREIARRLAELPAAPVLTPAEVAAQIAAGVAEVKLHEADALMQNGLAQKMMRERDASRAEVDALRDALVVADEFVTNGIALGYIRMPDADTPDSAHKTPGIIRAALKGPPA